MQQPVDYPLADDDKRSSFCIDEITYAAILDRHDAKLHITEEMIQSASRRIEAAHQFPFANKAQFLSQDEIEQISSTKMADARSPSDNNDANGLLSRWIRIIS